MGGPAIRVVSLVPSATETLRAWGVDPVACTRFCEQPDLPAVGGTKNPDITAIVALAPDLVVVDAEENRREDHEALVAAGVAVHALAIRSVTDLDGQLPALAAAVGATWTPLTPGPPPPPTLRAVVPIWRRPWMVLGRPTYGASLLAQLGVAVVPGDAGPYPERDLSALAALRPDVVLVPSEPYAFRDAHLAELASLAPAVRVDGRDLFWWGARTGAALGRLAELRRDRLEAVVRHR
jgi:ABC-type Fe3+-hydroxamate transport system substrate-binding protein